MRTLRPFQTVLALMIGICVAAPATGQTTWYVDDDAPGDPGPGDPTSSDPLEDGSAAHPYDAIQEGIDAAVVITGDEVVVLDGTYTGVGNKDLDYSNKAITVRSQNGPTNCIMDCEGSGRGFHFQSGETDTSVVDGFTITRGNAGIYGGGMFCQNGSPTVKDCIFKANSAGHGGGMANGDSSNSGSPTVVNCLFIGNTVAGHGGGMHNWNSNPTLTNCTLTANVSSTQPDAGMINFDSNPVITNCILWGNLWNSGSSGGIGNQGSSSPVVTYCCYEGGYAGNCNIDLDPFFQDAPGGNLHLQPGSPCIDAGNNGAVPLYVTTDIDGNPRFVDDLCTPDCAQCPGQCGSPPIVDMGAYEFLASPVNDCDGDGIDDICDPDIDGDGVPNGSDACPTTPYCDVMADGRPRLDLNSDCNVDGLDMQLIVEELLSGCSACN